MGKKVFELAKEMDMGAVDLVEKLKSLGFNIKNHMVLLSDEELEAVQKALAPKKEEASADKKKVVKKVTKKVIKKAGDKTSEKEAEVLAEEKATKAEKKLEKPVEINLQGEHKEASPVDASPALEEKEAVVPTPLSTIEGESPLVKFKVIRKKDKEEKEAQEIAAKARALEERASGKQGVELYREKMHTFTPIFVPEKKEPSPTTTAKTSVTPKSSGVIFESAPFPVEDEDENSKKKKLGGLAAMVSKKGKRDLSDLKTTEELKSYALGLVGKTVYIVPKKKKNYSGPTRDTLLTEVKESKRIITVHGGCTAEELAQKLNIKLQDLMNNALTINLLIKKNDYLGLGLAGDLCKLYDYRVEDQTFKEEDVIPLKKNENMNFTARSPIVAVMGHVDHGKTTLLDAIRKTKVAQGEAGGITQHIGAYSVKVSDKKITFLDTPGHAAFANMRQRGAKITDIVILVVAADDGVMPQTKESIRFCQEAGVPIIVAVNKMDKENSNPDRVKQELMEFSLTPEEWGGDTQYVPISALKGEGIDKLLEGILIQADVMELKADPKGAAEGVVVESKIEIGRGPVATIIVTQGTLKKGDSIVVGETSGRSRSLMDEFGNMLDSAGPSTPVQILGLDTTPSPGDMLNVTKNERESKRIVEEREVLRKEMQGLSSRPVASLEGFFAGASAGADGTQEKKILKLIVRSDVHGSFEAIKNAVEALGSDEVGVQVIGGGVGPITDSDVSLAASSAGYILGFNMRPVTTARKMAEDKGVDIKTYSIIYELINAVQMALEGMLSPEFVEKYIGRAQIKEVFVISKVGTVAGCQVVDGKIERGCNVRLLRDGKIMFDGKLSTLKRFKDEVKEVKNGLECGMALESFNDLKVGDLFEAYQMEQKKRTLDVPETSASSGRQNQASV
ncbi:MAG: translation initiation factor IF-2 [Bacteriovoracaceae bacterium]|nr:translation initiation factor IF-2 [Bacteriovoracaceae bacterium]